MPSLIHLNGPPAVGKSAVAAAMTSRRPLALNLDIDELRVRLGGWEVHDESKQVARGLGFRLAEWHLANGHDVLLPQLLVRLDVVQELEALARRAGAQFHEIVLTAPSSVCMERLMRGRSGPSTPHPRYVFDHDDLAARVAYSCEATSRIASDFTDALTVPADAGVAETATRVEVAIGQG